MSVAPYPDRRDVSNRISDFRRKHCLLEKHSSLYESTTVNVSSHLNLNNNLTIFVELSFDTITILVQIKISNFKKCSPFIFI